MTTSNGESNAYGLTTPDSWWNTTLEEVCSGDGGRIQTGPFEAPITGTIWAQTDRHTCRNAKTDWRQHDFDVRHRSNF